MFTEIDSSEIIVYLADKESGKESIKISRTKVCEIGMKLERQYHTLRVDTRSQSLEEFYRTCSPYAQIIDDYIEFYDVQSKQMKSIFSQYRPLKKTSDKIQKILDESQQK